MKKAKIFYARLDEFWRKEQKLSYLEKIESIQDIDWQEIQPNKKYVWLTEGLENEFDHFIALGSKESKKINSYEVSCIFKSFSGGVKTNRDFWVYNFDHNVLLVNIKRMIDVYEDHRFRLDKTRRVSSR